MTNAFTPKMPARLFSFAFAALITLAIMGSLDALATSGQSSEALLARHGALQVACLDPAGKI